MRAYLIDPVAKTVTEVDVPANATAAGIATMIGCEYVEALRLLDQGDSILADEEARLKRELPAPFRILGHYVVLGKALVIGVDRNGDWTDAATPLHLMREMTWFLDDVPEAAR